MSQWFKYEVIKESSIHFVDLDEVVFVESSDHLYLHMRNGMVIQLDNQVEREQIFKYFLKKSVTAQQLGV